MTLTKYEIKQLSKFEKNNLAKHSKNVNELLILSKENDLDINTTLLFNPYLSLELLEFYSKLTSSIYNTKPKINVETTVNKNKIKIDIESVISNIIFLILIVFFIGCFMGLIKIPNISKEIQDSMVSENIKTIESRVQEFNNGFCGYKDNIKVFNIEQISQNDLDNIREISINGSLDSKYILKEQEKFLNYLYNLETECIKTALVNEK